MDRCSTLAHIAARKQELVAQSNRLRSQMIDELAALERPVHWLETGINVAKSVRRNGNFLLSIGGGLLFAWKTWRNRDQNHPGHNSHSSHKSQAPSLLGRITEAASTLQPAWNILRRFI